MQKPFLLVDGSAYLYQAFYATLSHQLTNASGEPTGAIYGFVNMLRKTLNQYQPEKVAVVFDAKGKSFRADLYADYKATRDAMPSDLQQQIEPIHEIVKAMGLTTLVVDGVEADDVIGTLAKQAEKQHYPVLIHSGDKDMAQLVSPWVSLLNTKTETILDEQEVQHKFGVPPCKIIDFLALKGDSSDNIPGVPGIGDKSAITLLSHFAHLNDLYQRIDEIETLTLRGAKSIKQKLIDHEDLARLSYQLATIKTDVDLPISFEQMDWQAYDVDALTQLFKTYHLKQHLSALNQRNLFKSNRAQSIAQAAPDFPLDVPFDLPKQAPQYELILDNKAFDHWIARLKQADLIAFEIEADHSQADAPQWIGIAFSIHQNESGYIPLDRFDIKAILAPLKAIFEDKHIKKGGHDTKLSRHLLAQHHIELNGVVFDTLLESYLLNSQNRHDLESLCALYLDRALTSFDTLFEAITDKSLKKQKSSAQLPVEILGNYACEKVDFILQIHRQLYPKLEQIPALLKLFNQVELPLSRILMEMEAIGVCLDSEQLNAYSKTLEIALAQIETQIHQLAQSEININSPKQLQTVLFDQMQLPILKKTPKGDPSTNEEVLTELAKHYELPKLIMDYRGFSKLKNTYADKLPLMISAQDQRIHTHYNQVGTITGRLSSSDPNLQNIPVKNEAGRKIREAFVARSDYAIVSADYSQIELRIMAHLSCDQNLIEAFKQNKDIHRVTAAEILGKAEQAITQEERRRAKAVNFGLIYGMSAFGLAKQIDMTQKEAQFYIDRYFERYPTVLKYMAAMRECAHEQGFVETLLGRRLYLPKIKSRSVMERKGAERAAINAPMQGTAADIIKLAMIDVQSFIQNQTDEALFLLMQVHDELVFEVKTTRLAEMKLKIQEIMEKAFKLNVPLKVDVGSGSNWNEAH